MRPALELIGASFGYPGRMVLENISFSVSAREVFAIVGPNGVGKSTLIKAASGILPLRSGEILVEGHEITHMKPDRRARRIAVVPQGTHVPPAFTARQVVAMGRTPYYGWPDREGPDDRRMISAALQRAQTQLLGQRSMGELSGGERQRVMVARALAQAESVMLLDAPTAHLDLCHQDKILKLIGELAHQGRLAVLIALHDLNLVARYADGVALLSDGRIMKSGSPRNVLTPDDLAAAYGIEIQVIDHPVHGTLLVLPG